MKICEPECVMLKRRGAEYVAKLLKDKTSKEQLVFWQKRTEALLTKQAKAKSQTLETSSRLMIDL